MENKKKDLSNLFLDQDYIKFYVDYKFDKNNIVDMLEGNKNRMCICDTKEELYRQYFNATARLQELLRLRLKDFKKREELGYIIEKE